MYELIIFSVGLLCGGTISLALFGLGVNRATRFIYRIKEDVPLVEIGTPSEQEFTKE